MIQDVPVPELTLTFYNTESRKKEKFLKLRDQPVLIYTCGPTVYDYAHIGNFRTYVFEDLLKRTLQFFGYKVYQVMNLTDVDDKTIKGALKKGLSLNEFTSPYIQAFFEDIETLGISPASVYPRATEYIPQMIAAIEQLKNDGFAYTGADHSVYFSIEKLPEYGRLCKLNHQKSCSRINTDEYDKENVCDFTLWKAHDPERDGNIFWESPFGRGRPGWHLECSIMAIELLGDTVDIHAGGVDNIFPHHENEIAQSESLSGKQFVKYWLHSEHLLVNGKKMSKSLGNFYRIRDLLEKKFSGLDIRYMLIQSHYRTQLNFTEDGLKGCQQGLHKLQDFIKRLQSVPKNRSSGHEEDIFKLAVELMQDFAQSIANDLNIAEALAAMFHFIRIINSIEKDLSYQDACCILNILKKINQVLNIFSFDGDTHIPPMIRELAEERQIARQNKNWKQADDLRKTLKEKGFLIDDSKDGYRIKKLSTDPSSSTENK